MPLRGLGLGQGQGLGCLCRWVPLPLGAWAWGRVLAKLGQFGLGLCLHVCLQFGLLIAWGFAVDIVGAKTCIIVCTLCAYMFAVLLGAMVAV